MRLAIQGAYCNNSSGVPPYPLSPIPYPLCPILYALALSTFAPPLTSDPDLRPICAPI